MSSPSGLNKKDIYLAVMSYFLLSIPLFVYFNFKGINIVGDGLYYISCADDFIKRMSQGESVIQAVKQYDPFYTVCIIMLAMLKKLGGEHWQTAILLANAALYGMCAPVVYLLYRKCKGPASMAAAFGAVILPLGYPETLFLGNIPLRDVPFTGVAALASLLIIPAVGKQISIYRILGILLICLVLAMFKPSSIIFFCAAIFLLIYAWWSGGDFDNKYATRLLTIQLILSVIALIFWSYWFWQPFELPLLKLTRLMYQVRIINQQGVIILDHADASLGAMRTFWDYLELLMFKSLYYYHYWNPSQSTSHLIYRHFYFGLLFGNFAYCTIKLLIGKLLNKNITLKKVVMFAASLSVAGSMFQAVLVLAFEFRYQMVVFPLIWVITLINLTHIGAHFTSNRNRFNEQNMMK